MIKGLFTRTAVCMIEESDIEPDSGRSAEMLGESVIVRRVQADNLDSFQKELDAISAFTESVKNRRKYPGWSE